MHDLNTSHWLFVILWIVSSSNKLSAMLCSGYIAAYTCTRTYTHTSLWMCVYICAMGREHDYYWLYLFVQHSSCLFPHAIYCASMTSTVIRLSLSDARGRCGSAFVFVCMRACMCVCVVSRAGFLTVSEWRLRRRLTKIGCVCTRNELKWYCEQFSTT